MFVALLKSRLGVGMSVRARRALERALHTRRWKLIEPSPGQDLGSTAPGIIVVEAATPGDGVDRVRDLRMAWPDAAIVLVGSVGGPLDVVSALDAGADDVVHNATTEIEIVARIMRFGPRLERGPAGPLCPSTRLRHARALSVRRSLAGRSVAGRRWRGA